MNIDQNKVVVLLSGGQDSTVTLFELLQRGMDAHAVAINYGQRHASELEAAVRIANLARVPLETVNVPAVLKSTSPLVNDRSELEQYESFEQMEAVIGNRVELTFVPMRNLLFLAIAANRAVACGAGSIATGVCGADAANYPDCSTWFIADSRKTIRSALVNKPYAPGIDIITPLINLTKSETVHLSRAQGARAFAALAFSHTAYDGAYPPGRDHATVLRARGFEEAGLPDPLMVRAHLEGLTNLPDSSNYRDIKLIAALAEDIRDLSSELRGYGDSL